MQQQSNPTSTTRSIALESALASALSSSSVDHNHKAFKTLDLDDLHALAFGGAGLNSTELVPLRAYLGDLTEYIQVRNDGHLISMEARDEHIYAAMQVLSSRSNAPSGGNDDGIVVSSILPVDLTDNERRGSH